jgi:hypothetical protein
MSMDITPEQIRDDAVQERQRHIEQAVIQHEDRVKDALRLFKEEMAHIENTYQLRLSALPDVADEPDVRSFLDAHIAKLLNNHAKTLTHGQEIELATLKLVRNFIG